jgi:hypothetical protein
VGNRLYEHGMGIVLRNQAITLRTGRPGSMSEMGMFQTVKGENPQVRAKCTAMYDRHPANQ